MASAPDASKVAAFNAFDWNDERWKAHLNAIDLPHDSSGTQLIKVKARWYKRFVDSTFETEWVIAPATTTSSSSTQPAGSAYKRPAASSTPKPAPQASSQQQQQRAPPSSTPTTGGLSKSDEVMVVAAGVMMILLAVFHLVPVLSFIGLNSRACYVWFLRLTIFSQGYKIISRNGWPPVWPFSMEKIKMWLQAVLPTTEFFHVLVSFSFSSNPPITILLWPIAVPISYHVMSYLNSMGASIPHWPATGGRAHQLMMSKQRDATLSCAMAEIMVGFALIFRLITPQRNLLLIFFFWNMLKMRYLQSDASVYHLKVWERLDEISLPYRNKVPMVETLIGYVQRWFLSVR